MLQNLFAGLFDASGTEVIAVGDFMLCLLVSIALGCFLTFVYSRGKKGSRSFFTALAMLPAAVCVVIMMVNGNVGAGVAVAGAFSLVRFRSAPGNAREIGAIFVAMGAGLIAGMGYLAYSVLFTVVMSGFMFLLGRLTDKRDAPRELVVTIPEDLDYSGIFDDLFERYTTEHRLTSVKTSNMGSLFKLRYSIRLRDEKQEKSFIDDLRCRNGNLEVAVMEREETSNEL